MLFFTFILNVILFYMIFPASFLLFIIK